VFNVAMHRFAAKLALHVLYENQTADSDRFRPPILSLEVSSKCLFKPLAMGFLKLRCIGKAK
jgi:hypothetical protein